MKREKRKKNVHVFTLSSITEHEAIPGITGIETVLSSIQTALGYIETLQD